MPEQMLSPVPPCLVWVLFWWAAKQGLLSNGTGIYSSRRGKGPRGCPLFTFQRKSNVSKPRPPFLAPQALVMLDRPRPWDSMGQMTAAHMGPGARPPPGAHAPLRPDMGTSGRAAARPRAAPRAATAARPERWQVSRAVKRRGLHVQGLLQNDCSEHSRGLRAKGGQKTLGRCLRGEEGGERGGGGAHTRSFPAAASGDPEIGGRVCRLELH